MLLSLQLHSNGNCQAKVYFVFIAGNGFQCNMKRHQILVLLSAASFVACIGGFCGDLFKLLFIFAKIKLPILPDAIWKHVNLLHVSKSLPKLP